jgi:hypothetical protein
LDYLFKPNYGASLQILKVEIGGDTNSTVIADPSHMRTPDQVNCHRGFEWRLMKAAKARNPHIKFYGLMWGAPGWFKGGWWSPDQVRYLVKWLGCARANGLRIAYLGGANERRYTDLPKPSFFVALKHTLHTTFPNVQVIADDKYSKTNPWTDAKAMSSNPAYRNAVDILGEHDLCGSRTLYRHCIKSKVALSLHKPLWNSEQGAQGAWAGAAPLARAMNRNYIDARLTGNINWNLVSAYYGDTGGGGIGLMLAEWPWSGFYEVPPSIWVDAQTTQFAKPGWRYLNSGCGYLENGGSYVTLRSLTSGNYSVIIETMDATAPETISLHPEDGLSHRRLQVWSTDLASKNPQDWFVHDGALQAQAGKMSITVQPHRVYTLSTTTGQHKGTATPPNRPPSLAHSMPLPFKGTFNAVRRGHMAPYFENREGAFQVEPCVAGQNESKHSAIHGHNRHGRHKGNRPPNHGHHDMCLQQVITMKPIVWHYRLKPSTVVGDPLWQGNYKVRVDVMLQQAGYAELVGRIDDASGAMSGYHFQMTSAGRWKLYSASTAGPTTTLASGRAAVGVDRWHQLALYFRGKQLTASLDGRRLATVVDTTHSTGQVGLVVSPYIKAQFDNLKVAKTTPWPRFILNRGVTATASSSQTIPYQQHVYTPDRAIDGRVESCWMSNLNSSLPQSITLDLGKRQPTDGLMYRPPLFLPDAAVTGYSIFLSNDGHQFTKAAAGRWAADTGTKYVTWPRQTARFVRFEATASSGGALAAACGLNVARTPLSHGPVQGSVHPIPQNRQRQVHRLR